MAELSVLSPLHIGNGNEFTLIDFIIGNKNFININFDKVVDYCSEKSIKLDEEIEKEKENFKMEEFFKKYSLKPEDYSRYVIPLNIDFSRIRQTKPKIKEFIKGANKFPYIPGSSIKGAIRTALLWAVLQDKDIFEYCDKLYKDYVKPKIACKGLEEKIFGTGAHKDILRVLRISDTKQLELKNLEVNEIKIIGNPASIPTYVENLKSGSMTNFDLWIDEKLLKEDIFNDKIIRNYLNTKSIFKICNEFCKEILVKQLNYRFNPPTVKKEFEQLKKDIENCKENEMILNLGWGGGWYPKTIGLKIERYNEWENGRKLRYTLQLGKNPKTKRFVLDFPKTRRMTIDDKPLGWVKVKI